MSALSVGHINREGSIELDLMDWIQAGVGKYEGVDRLPFDVIADWLADACKNFNVREGLGDQHMGVPLEDASRSRGVTCIEAKHHTRDFNALIYKNFKDMMWDGRLELYNWPLPQGQQAGQSCEDTYCDYLEELLELEEHLMGRDLMIVKKPPLQGKFDDRSDALARMIWLASQRIAQNPRISRSHQRGSRPGYQAPMSHRKETMKRRLGGGSHSSRQIPGNLNRRKW